jgi:hypothetical protein
MMSNLSFEDDALSRKVTRVFLLLQIAGMTIVVILSFLDLFLFALAISYFTFFIFIAIVLWLYSRYHEIPLVREKRELERLFHRFQKRIQAEEGVIQAAITERTRLFHAEKEEIHWTLRALQKDYIERELARASLQVAPIPGIGPKLKERLAEYGVESAAQITEKIADIPGFEEAKRLALISWRSSVLAALEDLTPQALPEEQLESIQGMYHALHNTNNAAERKARASKQILEHELISFKPRLQELAPLTFVNYLSKSLASHGIVAALIAFVLIVTQVMSSVSATASTAASMIASIPTATTTVTPIPTATLTLAPTFTLTPTITHTPTMTSTPSVTHTPLATFTLRPSSTPSLVATPTGGSGNGNCHPAYRSVCIPPPPPDLDCGDVPYDNFEVLPPDPHNFDREGDGLGCES